MILTCTTHNVSNSSRKRFRVFYFRNTACRVWKLCDSIWIVVFTRPFIRLQCPTILLSGNMSFCYERYENCSISSRVSTTTCFIGDPSIPRRSTLRESSSDSPCHALSISFNHPFGRIPRTVCIIISSDTQLTLARNRQNTGTATSFRCYNYHHGRRTSALSPQGPILRRIDHEFSKTNYDKDTPPSHLSKWKLSSPSNTSYHTA